MVNELFKLAHTIEEHEEGVWSVAWSPDGNYLATGLPDKKTHFYEMLDFGEPELISTIEEDYSPFSTKFKKHHNEVTSISWSPDGKHVAVSQRDKKVQLYDFRNPEKPERLTELNDHKSSVNCVSWSPDGRYLATGSSDELVNVYDVTEVEMHELVSTLKKKRDSSLSRLKRHKDDVWSVDWSPDNKLLAVGKFNNEVDVYNMQDAGNPEFLETIIYHTPLSAKKSDLIISASWSPDGKYLATASFTRITNLYDMHDQGNSRHLKKLAGKGGSSNSIAWSPDGKYLANNAFFVTNWEKIKDGEDSEFGGEVIVYDVHDIENSKFDTKLSEFDDAVWAIAWSPDSKYLAATAKDGKVNIYQRVSDQENDLMLGHDSQQNLLSI